MVAGEFLTADDRSGILIGKRLADSLGVSAGQKVSLTVVNADGQPDESIFTIRGVFATGIPSYDESTVFMPLAKAQAFTGTGNRASAVIILLHDQDDAGAVATALQGPGVNGPHLARVELGGVADDGNRYVLLRHSGRYRDADRGRRHCQYAADGRL